MSDTTKRRWARHCLRVQDAAMLAAFYREQLGMTDFGTPSRPLLGYDPAQCLLELRDDATAPYQAGARDFYWKIGLTLRDLVPAVAALRAQGWQVSEPRQFRDIGYLCHLRDPEGFAIELLQQGFEGRARPAGPGHPVGGQATFAHITLRVSDIAAARAFCEDRHGLRLMSIQPVPERAFTLYFYAWNQESLPDPALTAVGNREWLWARPYSLLELQHLENGDAVRPPDPDRAGFAGIAFDDNGDLTYVEAADMAALWGASGESRSS
ncbi:MAG: VOC family protein [Pseudomonadota bacterium]